MVRGCEIDHLRRDWALSVDAPGRAFEGRDLLFAAVDVLSDFFQRCQLITTAHRICIGIKIISATCVARKHDKSECFLMASSVMRG